MIAVKIECDCGQHYAFDVEPVNGRMASEVACPSCGADGTPAANHAIAQQLGPPPPDEPIIHIPPPKPKTAPATTIPVPPPEPRTAPVALAPAGAGLKINKSEAAPDHESPKIAVSDRELGIVSREQALAEARAKVSWGDSEEEVIKFLMVQRFTVPEARDVVAEMFKERMATVRTTGVRKIFTGIGLMCVPVIALLFFLHLGLIPMKIMAIFVMIGLYGLWLLINGIIAFIAPKMESGDVAEQ